MWREGRGEGGEKEGGREGERQAIERKEEVLAFAYVYERMSC